jgi:hypothetical protein
MADKKITQLPSASIATANNVLPIVQDGATEQITVTNLANGILNLGLAVTASTVTANSNGLGTNFKVGDDVWIGDVNLSNTMQIRGQQTATTAFVKFGSGSNSPIVGGVAGSDLFQITGSVNVTGSITANGFTGPLTGTASVAITSSMALGVTASATAGNAAHNVLFQDTAGSSLVNWDAGLRYNPSSNILTTTASFASNTGLLDGKDSSQFANKVTGSWTLATGSNTVSFTVTPGGTYSMWVNGNIANGIVTWNATVTTSNANVAVVGSQFGWYYLAGNALILTSIPSQIVGENGVISTTLPETTTSNVFTFGITNNSGAPQTVDWGYITL